jgi:DNA-binding LytR/AlgR family response regulator
MIRCVIIDDEPLALEVSKSFIEKIPQLQLIGSFTDAIEGVEFIRKQKPDILFLDIQMPDVNGIQLLKSLDINPVTIFTTAYSKYAIDGFELNAADYLLKPFSFERFERAVQKASAIHEQRITQQKNKELADYFFVKSEYQQIKINVADVRYMEGLDDYVKIHLKEGRPILTLMSLKNMLEKLAGLPFQRVHRSFIVPLHQVKAVRNKKIILLDGTTEIPIGASYAEEVSKWLKGDNA